MLDWGVFWAVNMRFVERLHVLLKKNGAGHKDMYYVVCGVLDFVRPF